MPEPMNYVSKMEGLIARELPGLNNRLLSLYALLALIRGRSTTLEDVHDAWAVWRNETNPGHKSLIPFHQLSLETQELDRKYADGIRRAVEEYYATTVSGR